MRLQLVFALVWLCAPCLIQDAAAQELDRGEGSAVTTVAIYSDDDATTVTTTLVDAEVAVADEVVLGSHVLIDVVSSASVDVVSAATARYQETRVETGASVRFPAPRGLETRIAWVHSKENDWKSNSLQASVARDFARKNTRVQASYGFVSNAVGRSGDPAFEQSLSSHSIEVAVTQLINRLTLATLSYTRQTSDGWQSSPYRYVSTSDGQMTFLESHPKHRSRHAFGLRVARYLGKDTAADLAYRFYRDDWGLLSHTAQSSVRYAPGQNWDLRLRLRFYIQGAAHFWFMHYQQPMIYMSGDRELSTFWNLAGGAKLARRVGALRASAKLDLIRYSFLDFAKLDSRLAMVASGQVSYRW